MLAGPRMGAGIVECDVVFTADRQLVCRHDQCDLHTTTNIVTIPALNAKCTQPFQAANPKNGTDASAKCCTSDITLADFKSLCGKMDGFNASAATPADYLRGTPPFRTDLYSTCGTVMTHKEYIGLVDSLGLQFTPELKVPQVPMPFRGGNYTQHAYAQQMVDEYRAAGIDFRRVWPQSLPVRRPPVLDPERARLCQAGPVPGRERRHARHLRAGHCQPEPVRQGRRADHGAAAQLPGRAGHERHHRAVQLHHHGEEAGAEARDMDL